MKKVFSVIMILASLLLAGCFPVDDSNEVTTESVQTTQPQTTATEPTSVTTPSETEQTQPHITEPSAVKPTETIPAETEPPLLNGWVCGEDAWYYFEDGIAHAGWLELDGGRYWFREDGAMCTGWVEVDGLLRFFSDNGLLGQGWTDVEDKTYYLDEEGVPVFGWLSYEDDTYFLNENGTVHTGWLEYQGERYFFKENGIMGKGKVAVSEDEVRYFTSTGKEVILVNPWNYVPGDYEVTLAYHLDYWQVAQEALEPLERMLSDCKKAGYSAVVVSSYRTNSYQADLYKRRVQRFIDQGYSREEAEIEAAKRVAIPGTSEHELGLAMDIVDRDYQKLTQKQETMPAQQWLMEHCWEYGFILRYPNEKSHVTGIIYEPWHYRYVGAELAMELRDSGLCLEEYLESLTQ